jgi:hypothetical protein
MVSTCCGRVGASVSLCPHSHVSPRTEGWSAYLVTLQCGLGWPQGPMLTPHVSQDRKIAHCPFHALMPVERETFLTRKRLLEHMAMQLRRAVFAKESQWDTKMLYLSKRGGHGCLGLTPWLCRYPSTQYLRPPY